jgi:proteasome lid subunit RPN8/RPN11
VNPYLSTALAALEDLRDEIHHQANRQFFQSRTVSYGDLLQQETTVRNALQLLQTLPYKDPFPSEADLDAELAS